VHVKIEEDTLSMTEVLHQASCTHSTHPHEDWPLQEAEAIQSSQVPVELQSAPVEELMDYVVAHTVEWSEQHGWCAHCLGNPYRPCEIPLLLQDTPFLWLHGVSQLNTSGLHTSVHSSSLLISQDKTTAGTVPSMLAGACTLSSLLLSVSKLEGQQYLAQ